MIVQYKDYTPKQTSADPALILLNICGGGITVQQTAKAMVLHRTYNETGKVTYKGWKLTK